MAALFVQDLAARANVRNGFDRDAQPTDHAAYDKIKSLVTLIRSCRTRAEVHELLSLVPMMGEYVRLPNGNDVDVTRVNELRSQVVADGPVKSS